MAKKSSAKKVNVSAEIREYITANPEIGPTEAAKAVSEKIGKIIPPNYISNLKTKMGGGKKRRKVRRGMTIARKGKRDDSYSLSTYKAARELVGQLGADAVHKLVDGVS